MEALINSLLDYSQVGRSEMSVRPTDMNEVVRGALDSLRARLEENSVKIDLQQSLPVVTCDRVQALEVFTNLISNAVKYNDQEAKFVKIGCQENADEPVFFVQDNGIGIEDDNKNSIFQIFKRLHGKDKYGGGSGTGLTIAKKIIERHNGRIWVESEVGRGTTFFFSFGRM
jgi:two-component system, chemotaxis family, sensor kinase Cph1